MAIDRDAILKDVYLGAGEKAKTLIPTTMWAYNDDIPQTPYDPREGQGDAGGGRREDAARHRPLVSCRCQRPYNPNGKRIGEMMQADLAKIGVNAKLVTYEWGEYRKRSPAGEDITGQYGWTGDNGDPDNFFFLRGCPGGKPGNSNPTKWCNAEFDDLLVKARIIADQAERAKLYQRMQEIEHDEAPELLIAHSTVFEAMRANVTGYKQSPLGTPHVRRRRHAVRPFSRKRETDARKALSRPRRRSAEGGMRAATRSSGASRHLARAREKGLPPEVHARSISCAASR